MPLTGLAPGATYQLQFAEVDDQGAFNFGVDDVSIDFTASTAAVPEPNSLRLLVPLLGLLVGAGLAGVSTNLDAARPRDPAAMPSATADKPCSAPQTCVVG